MAASAVKSRDGDGYSEEDGRQQPKLLGLDVRKVGAGAGRQRGMRRQGRNQ